MVLDASRRHVAAVVVSKRKKHGSLVDWDHVTGFGPDAVMVDSEEALRPPADDQEQAAADGKLKLVGKLALSETGNQQGPITDVEFDPDSGNIGSVLGGEERLPTSDLLGIGSYAAVLPALTAPIDRRAAFVAWSALVLTHPTWLPNALGGS